MAKKQSVTVILQSGHDSQLSILENFTMGGDSYQNLGVLEIYEDMVEVLLVLEIFLT